ncbi:hypothetical protein [Liquorilactobacillus nagelii]|jgi:hypothetical protein|uniref:hypothetical protein n=1 Tax=Liquorilactobacillus nagelii TaxID=82688 RepID=UPI0006EFC737|nr:hypothetical protein [Liquorilactobacillus nagelii]KRL39909.1 hypothetical protein FD45_GL000085 [Liquorilactobacillus nagelii DSM 13675]QYH53426.1 hypothetical protein G6O73_01430 [Liquorilactobacillus nagelii DSM 13675]
MKLEIKDQSKQLDSIIKSIGIFTIVILKMLGLISLSWKPLVGALILLYLFL